ncbi:hypothetical protein G4B88_028561 [Cannabis sativa]|uniref:Uncharacterized protein n=1 Tax=Cannabis sativa TaxID=3483 RepID=A0A7J6F1Y6_CANSA|nr:hypothetical protein G4B88_028561 [Cannabis sativa]
MDTGPAGLGLAADDKSSSSPAEAFSRWSFTVSRRFQHFLDKSTPHLLYRWLGCLGVALIYALRVYLVEGFYIVSDTMEEKEDHLQLMGHQTEQFSVPMETGAAAVGLAADDQSSSSSSSSPAEAFSRWTSSISRRYQHFLDKSTPHVLHRWLGCLGVALIYALRVYLVEGFYIVSDMMEEDHLQLKAQQTEHFQLWQDDEVVGLKSFSSFTSGIMGSPFV